MGKDKEREEGEQTEGIEKEVFGSKETITGEVVLK